MAEEWSVKGRKGAAKRDQYQLEKSMTTSEWAAHRAAYRLTAEQYRDEMVRSHRPTTGMRTVCYMASAKTGGDGLFWTSGESGAMGADSASIKDNRSDSAVAATKKTVCAEEHILVEHTNRNFMFSFALNEHGLVAACAGCGKLLRDRQIIDLGAH